MTTDDKKRGRPKGANLGTTISLKLPAEMLEKVKILSKSKGLDSANLIRLSIAEYLERNGLSME